MESKTYEGVRFIRSGEIRYKAEHSKEFGWVITTTWPSYNSVSSTLGHLTYAELKSIETVAMQNHWPIELIEIFRDRIDKALEEVLARLTRGRTGMAKHAVLERLLIKEA